MIHYIKSRLVGMGVNRAWKAEYNLMINHRPFPTNLPYCLLNTDITQPFLLNNFLIVIFIKQHINVIMLYSNYNIIVHCVCYPSRQSFLNVEARLQYACANCHSVFHFGMRFAYHKTFKLVMTNQFSWWPTRFRFDWPLCPSNFFVKLYTG